MSDDSVGAALRSSHPLVVVEAPAGCGKTHQAAEYAADAASTLSRGRVLIVAHTHAAVDVFVSRTPQLRDRVDVRTIDSLIVAIAAAYHQLLELPPDPGRWAQSEKDGYATVAAKVAALLKIAPAIKGMLARRYPIVICDEHQDASSDQHDVTMALYRAGASLRFFGDPMQNIYATKKTADADLQRWNELKTEAGASEELDTPHRWSQSTPLGQWILSARALLRDGGRLNLASDLPAGIDILRADNLSSHPLGYSVGKQDRVPIDDAAQAADKLLVLTAHKSTVEALNAFFNRRVPIWEGHVRDGLSRLADEVRRNVGNPEPIATALVNFVETVCTGFSRSMFGNRFIADVAEGCAAKRKGMPARLQVLGTFLVNEPDHRGVAKALRTLAEFTQSDAAFRCVKIDHRREYREAVSLGDFADCDEGFAEIARRRTGNRAMPPGKAISTVHKAKGLECPNVMIVPCDATRFPDTPAGRRLLYVAMSRATRSLTIVVPRSKPSPLFTFS
ncbi:MAG: hypothetical protein QOK37_280 [Thermoanaerobaculia bacterium]|jgi:DNA helicase-2/ATP-dependent DNA helicase PcrA|nr:hypothetical protein [Thermoanaerobaculia bacterium]